MANQYDIVSELKKYSGNTRICYAVRIGKKSFIPIEQAYQLVARAKIRFISEYLSNRGITVRRSKSSGSIYFIYNGVTFRVSDHPAFNPADLHHDIIVTHNSCVIQKVSFIFSQPFNVASNSIYL